MKLFQGVMQKNYNQRKRKYILSGLILVAAAAALLAAAFSQADMWLRAENSYSEESGEFRYETDKLGGARVTGKFSLLPPNEPNIMDNASGFRPFDESAYYGNPKLNELKMFFDNWNTAISYTDVLEPNIDSGSTLVQLSTNKIGLLENGNYNKTYYIVSDTPDAGLTYRQLWADFLRYVEAEVERLEELEEPSIWETYQLKKTDPEAAVPYLYGLVEQDADIPLDAAELMAKELDSYFTKFITEEKRAVEYSNYSGIALDSIDKKNAGYVCAIRVGMSRLDLGFSTYIDNFLSRFTRQCIPVVMLAVSNYEIKFKTPHAVPQVKAYSETPIHPVTGPADAPLPAGAPDYENSIFKDEAIALSYTQDFDIKKELRYAVYSSDYSIEDVRLMGGWIPTEEHKMISLSDNSLSVRERYLYIKTAEVAPDNGGDGIHGDSEIVKYKFVLNKDKAPADISMEVIGGGDIVDVGDEVELKNNTKNAVTFYTANGGLPSLKLFEGTEELSIEQLNAAATQEDVYFTEAFPDFNYLRVNNFWYACSKEVKKYTAPIKIGEEIRNHNRLLVIAFSVEAGKEISDYVSVSKAYELKRQVSAPTSDIQTSDSNPAEIEMGTTVNFSCETIGSEIYYTTNGTAPVVIVEKDEETGKSIIKPGNDFTQKYDISTGIPITENSGYAEYGGTVTLMVKAVCYEDGIRTMKDSEAVKFIYRVKALGPAEPVSSIPATSQENPVIVIQGDKIMLYCKTEGATIYYTTDGTDPVINGDGSRGAGTRKYDATKGIQVPRQANTHFTITAVAHAKGYSASELVRLVYKYPDAVAAPYAVPGSGVVNEHTAIILRASAENAVIYYEMAFDGKTPADPTQKSSVYDEENPIIITRRTAIKAIAVSGGVSSVVNTFSYSVSSKLSIPVPSLQSGSVISSGTSLTLTADPGASVYYTLDGSNPTDAGNSSVNVGTRILLEGDAGSIITIRTYAAKEGFSNSEIGTYNYSMSNYSEAIFADKESGSIVKNGDTVKLNTDVSNAVIYYTTDGSMPTQSGQHGDTVIIQGQAGGTVTLKAIAVIPGSTQMAAAATFTYTIMRQLHAPTSNVPTNAIFTEEGQVMLSAEEGAIYYTTDGSQPTTGSSAYIDSITVNRNMTIRAIAVSEEADISEVSTFVYQFAQQVDMPTVSHENGELIQNTEISITCATPDASIYYTTNGTDPDMDNKESLNVYTGPIMIDKAITIKAVATKSGMQNSPVLTVGYTVRPPIVKEEKKQPSNVVVENNSGRLISRRTYSGENTGPSFRDILLKNPAYGVLLASKFDIIPDESNLSVNKTNTSQATKNMIKQELGEYFDVVSSYDIKLDVAGEEIQPDGTVEIGIPITADYENGIVYMVHMEEDGTIQVEDTRRSGGMIYAMVDSLSEYSIAAPEISEEKKGNLLVIVLSVTGVVALLSGITFLVVRRRRKYYDR